MIVLCGFILMARQPPLAGFPSAEAYGRGLDRHNVVDETETGVVVQTVDGDREFVRMRWGLVPSWWPKPLKELKAATFNARTETVADKPFFRDAFRRTRCLIPASGYYEWQNTVTGKQPWYFTRADGEPMTFAGLWDEWKDKATGEALKSCTILITRDGLRERRGRFSPARAGNALGELRVKLDHAVHPRACGERIYSRGEHGQAAGSSPRVRGTRDRRSGGYPLRRFIPARAGNANRARSRRKAPAVHPRACGERFARQSMTSNLAGSSPRVRGTRLS
jgi:hypothetical protein